MADVAADVFDCGAERSQSAGDVEIEFAVVGLNGDSAGGGEGCFGCDETVEGADFFVVTSRTISITLDRKRVPARLTLQRSVRNSPDSPSSPSHL